MIFGAALSFLSQLDAKGILAVFWFMILLEVPRYAFSFVSTGAAHALAGLRRKPRADRWRRRPTVSVIIAGHNEAGAMRPCLRSLAEQTLLPDEIICINDGSTDGMRRVLGELREEGLIDAAFTNELRCGKPAACNLAINFSRGDIVINVDADCSFDRDALERIIEPLSDPAVGAVSGNIGVRNAERSIVASLQAIEYLTSISLGKLSMDVHEMVFCASGAFSAFRREALLQVGSLEPGPGEDFDLTLRLHRAGWKIRFAGAAWCFTDVPETLPALIRQRRRWDRDTIRLRLRKFHGTLNPLNRRFQLRPLLDQFDFLILNLGSTLIFPLYIGWMFWTYGGLAWCLLTAVSIVYMAFDLLTFLVAVAVTGRYGLLRLLPFAIGFGVFNAYVMRAMRLYAYFEEWVFRASYRDAYVPQRVLDQSPLY